ncbi:RRM domain-containing protein [Mycena chlorophos]|uniref:RRM domain-containing protein n=1 Tax=Mycena chlorophos TaxID=658473 RepID=A0A8H6TNU0_MYCCL|nr:RRM domain-containing protein [Mycena chlorophos]
MRRILHVRGFHPNTRAKDLAVRVFSLVPFVFVLNFRALQHEFERFGPLVRCDVPAPRNPHANTNPYAFVEFRSTRDAEDAYHEMHGKNFEGARLSVEWARRPPSTMWRVPNRDRSRSPRRRDDRDRDRDRDRNRSRDRERRRRSRTRSRSRRRSPSPKPDDGDRDREAPAADPIEGTNDNARHLHDRDRSPTKADEA